MFFGLIPGMRTNDKEQDYVCVSREWEQGSITIIKGSFADVQGSFAEYTGLIANI